MHICLINSGHAGAPRGAADFFLLLYFRVDVQAYIAMVRSLFWDGSFKSNNECCLAVIDKTDYILLK
jgi:hypothetical protein